MRHSKRRHSLGVSGPHLSAMMGNLAVALITHGRIQTTLTKAKALRPFIEKIITFAKKAEAANDTARKLHYRRLAISRVRDKKAVAKLFDERASEFTDRNGGYTRIYKVGQRIGDAAEMALIELIDGNDEGYSKKPAKKATKKATNKAAKAEAEVAEAEVTEAEVTEAEVTEAEVTDTEAKKPVKKAAKKAAKKAVKKETPAKEETDA
jgi:large subunit ribosomal protein L17